MGTVELLQHQEKATWSAYLQSQKSEDLTKWSRALKQLQDELEQRVRLLQTSAQRVRP